MQISDIIGEHPAPDAFGCHTVSEDGCTASGVPHRSLKQEDGELPETVEQIRAALIKHHASPAMIARDRRKIGNLIRQGYPVTEEAVHRFPRADKTRKGNLTEVFLAEYLDAATTADLPVYRLRYNPNVEQSMKGDDVLAFDFSSERPRIIIGETKYRATPTKQSVADIIGGLVRSNQAGLPASLQFVADRLYESDQIEIADRISDCAIQMAQGKLDLSYVGLLMSTPAGKAVVDQHTELRLHSLVMISLSVAVPQQLVVDCFNGLEEEAHVDPN